MYTNQDPLAVSRYTEQQIIFWVCFNTRVGGRKKNAVVRLNNAIYRLEVWTGGYRAGCHRPQTNMTSLPYLIEVLALEPWAIQLVDTFEKRGLKG